MRRAVAEMTPSQRPRRRGLHLACVFALALAGPWIFSLVRPASASASLCDPGVSNPIACENSKPGTPQDVWDAPLDPSPSIEGFATDISVDHGQTVHFKVKTDAQAYRIDIYRLGYYNGMGARQVATVYPTSLLPQIQPGCMTDTSTGLVDCGNWAESASWAVPADAVSGVYLARLVRTDTGEASHIIFIVRDDEAHSNLLFKTSDTTRGAGRTCTRPAASRAPTRSATTGPSTRARTATAAASSSPPSTRWSAFSSETGTT
jgi:hypothetical protein